jgi:outer membrane protein assembly factor BamB
MIRYKTSVLIMGMGLFFATALGCHALESVEKLGEGMETQMQRRGPEIEAAIVGMMQALGRSAEDAQDRVTRLAENLKTTYGDGGRSPKLVYFTEDAARPEAVAPGKPTADEPEDHERVFVKPEPVQANLLTERTLEHRGLRVLWNLPLDGSGVRYADIDGEDLYVVTQANRIYAIQLRVGLTRWVTSLPRRPDSSPGFNKDYVVISAGDIIRVIDKATGRDRWRFETRVQPASRPFCSASYFVYGCWTGEVAGFQFGDRHPTWRFRADARVFVRPMLVAGQAFAAADSGVLSGYNTATRIAGNDIKLGGRPVGMVASQDRVFVGTDNFEVVAVRASDLGRVWSHASDGRVIAGPWLSENGHTIYYAAGQDGFYALAAGNGRPRWKMANGVKPVGAHGDALFVLQNGGTLSYASATTGRIEWSEPIAPFVSAVENIREDVVVLIAPDGQIYALAPKQ